MTEREIDLSDAALRERASNVAESLILAQHVDAVTIYDHFIALRDAAREEVHTQGHTGALCQACLQFARQDARARPPLTEADVDETARILHAAWADGVSTWEEDKQIQPAFYRQARAVLPRLGGKEKKTP